MTTELVPAPDTTTRRRRRRTWYLVGGAAFVALAVVVIAWFQPQKLFLDDTVNEALPDLVVDHPRPGDRGRRREPDGRRARRCAGAPGRSRRGGHGRGGARPDRRSR